MNEKLIRVGSFDTTFNSLLNTSIPEMPIFRSKGLQAHIMKQRHYKAIGYIDLIPDIIRFPDYIGVTTKDGVAKLEYIKCYKDSIELCIKISPNGQTMYVATMYDIPQKKIDRFLHSGRIIKVDEIKVT